MKRKYKSTMVELVTELEAISPRTPQIEHMIKEAKAGEYHDYKNTKYPCGKVQLYDDLKKSGLNDLARKVVEGEWDEEADEEDKKNLKEAALKGGFTETQCKELFGL